MGFSDQGRDSGLLWNVLSTASADAAALGPESLDDDWVITIDTGAIIPRSSSIRGSNASAVRSSDGDGTYHVTVAATPVVATGECDTSSWPWVCPETATTERVGYLGGDITDFGSWEDEAERSSMLGLDYATNVAAASTPPEIDENPQTGVQQLLIRLANPHFRIDGTTVFVGFAHLRIPNAFLSTMWGIDDPATLTGSGVVADTGGPAAGSGTATVSSEPGGNAILVDVEGITFSACALHIRRGVVIRTRPTRARATHR